MTKIPNIQKFKGDNQTSFKDWKLQFEAQLAVLGIGDDKKKEVLLCCTEGGAFQTVVAFLAANIAATYEEVANHLTTKYSGEEYKRTLEVKLRNLVYKKGTNINSYANDLRITVKELYGLENQETINSICINHVTGNLENSIKKDVTILQLTGNKSLVNLLELVSTKMEGNFLSVNETRIVKNNPQFDVNSRMDKLESMFKQLMNDTKPRQEANCCRVCGKTNHKSSDCFKNKTCFVCNKKGHISKFCRQKNDNNGNKSTDADSAKFDLHNFQTRPGVRNFLKVNIDGKYHDFLRDSGSQFTILKREDYDRLTNKPPLTAINKKGVGVNGSEFKLDGICYLNLKLESEHGDKILLEYKPVLISSQIKTNILGIKSEESFKEITQNNVQKTLTYTLKDDEKVVLKYYEESIEPTSAYIEVLKSSVVTENSSAFIKAKVVNGKDLDGTKDYIINGDQFIKKDVNVHDLKIDNLPSTIIIPVTNLSEENYKFKKGDIVGTINEISEVKLEQCVNTDSTIYDKINTRNDLARDEKVKLIKIFSDYEQAMDKIDKSSSQIQYEHEIKLRDDVPVAFPPRRLAYSQREEVDRQIKDLLDRGYIEESTSSYGAPIVPVVKKNGSLRVCIDYRGLNSKTIPKSFPVGRLEDLLEGVNGVCIFSVLDLREAYYHVPLKLEDKHKTAFVHSNKKYEWNRMPFGLYGAAFSLAAALVHIFESCV